MRVEFGLDPWQQVVADPSVDEQLVGRLEDEAIGAVEARVALCELIDLVGGDVAVEGDLDVLAPLVGGPPLMGDAQDRQLAPAQWERAALELVAVESPERLGQSGVADERPDDGEPFGVVGVARSEAGHPVARHAEQ